MVGSVHACCESPGWIFFFRMKWIYKICENLIVDFFQANFRLQIYKHLFVYLTWYTWAVLLISLYIEFSGVTHMCQGKQKHKCLWDSDLIALISIFFFLLFFMKDRLLEETTKGESKFSSSGIFKLSLQASPRNMF